MALYRYIKSTPTRERSHRNVPVLISLLSISVGIGLLFWVGWPIIAFTVFTQNMLVGIVSPLAQDESSNKSPFAPPVLAAGEVVSSVGVGLTNANAWFPTLPQKKVVTPVNTYSISVPKLKISEAMVIIGGSDLSKSLIHYGGTGLPGEYGNAVIFGHSTLPQFYNPKNYTSIFSTLPTLEEEDDIFVTYDGVTFRYRVFRMTVLDPSDLTLLEQRFDDSYVTLVTCVPPGTYWKRLYVQARLVRPTQ
ncbi:sortase [Candidatus Gottesmanbacteria bacterium]|nr:sortase [Candidatus Gottesmanbacteria bacterium]